MTFLSLEGVDYVCKSGDCRRLEDNTQRHVYFESVHQHGHDAGGEQRVSTQLEEIIFHSHALHLQHLPPDFHHHFFCLITRRHVAATTHHALCSCRHLC